MNCLKKPQLRDSELSQEASTATPETPYAQTFSFGNSNYLQAKRKDDAQALEGQSRQTHYKAELPAGLKRYLKESARKYSGMSDQELIHQLKEEKFQLYRRVNYQEMLIERLSRALDQYNKFFIRRTETIRNTNFQLEKSFALLGSTMQHQSMHSTFYTAEIPPLPMHQQKQYLFAYFDKLRKHKSVDSEMLEAYQVAKEEFKACNESAIGKGGDISLNDNGDELVIRAQFVNQAQTSSATADQAAVCQSPQSEDALAAQVTPIENQSVQTPRILQYHGYDADYMGQLLAGQATDLSLTPSERRSEGEDCYAPLEDKA